MNCPNCRPTKMILKGTPEELSSITAKKLLLIATHCTDLPVVCETSTSEECGQLSHLAKSLVMLIVFCDCGDDDDEVIAVATSRAMMKTIASLALNGAGNITASRGGLAAKSHVDEAVVDGWLSFLWNSIDLPLEAASVLLENETCATTAEAEMEVIEDDLKSALKKIETHLSKKETFVSNNSNRLSIVATNCGTTDSFYTVADLSLAVTLHFMFEKNIAVSAMSSEENPHLYSWRQSIHKALDLVPGVN